MELLLAAVAVVALYLFFRKRPKKPEPRISPLPDVLEDDYDDESEPKWHSVDYMWGKAYRREGWVALKGASDVSVSGLSKYNGMAFVKSIEAGVTSLDLVREPDNPEDETAIAVYGQLNPSTAKAKIGYLPASLAGDIAAEFSPELPIEAELRRAGWKHDACFMAINVIVPAAKDRKKYLL